MLINEKHILLETGVQVRFQTKFPYHRVVVAVDVSIHSIHALEDLTNECRERFRKRNAWVSRFSKPFPTTEILQCSVPILLGSTDSLSMFDCTQVMSCSM